MGAPPSTDDKQALLVTNIEAWGGHDYTVTSQVKTLAEAQVALLESRPNVSLREYTVRGSFPRQIVQAHWSSTGEATVMTPKELRLLIAESIPARLIKLTASPGL